MAYTHQTESVQSLEARITGSVLTPDDADYDRVRRGWNLTVNQYPALILLPENAQDVAEGMRFARQEKLNVAVQATGHGQKHPADNELMISTSRLNAVSVNAEARTARVESGVMWGKVVEAAVPFGLAPLLGSAPHVGVVGYTLGGGIGWLGRKYGYAADSVHWIELVTADGELIRTSATENSDLFNGLRGGGGNFGVVTALEFDLYPVATLYGGNMVYPGEMAGEALRFFREWVKHVPEALTSSIQVIKYPSFPQLPDAIRGKTRVYVRAAYTGNPEDSKPYIQAWMDWCAPQESSFRVMPFAEIATISNDPVEPGATLPNSEMLDDLSDEVIDIVVRHMTDTTSPLLVTEIRHAGGALQHRNTGSVIGNRDAQFYLVFGGSLFRPELRTPVITRMNEYRGELQPYVRGGTYLNFSSADFAHGRGKDAYTPEHYAALLALKAKYDPDNVFRYAFELVEAEKAG